MNNKGFIAISMLYSFFIVFVVIMFGILNFYSDNIANMRLINESIIENYNKVEYCFSCNPKTQNYFGNASDLTLGSYVYLPIENYDGLFIVADIQNPILLISDQIVDSDSNISLDKYNFMNNGAVSIFSISSLTDNKFSPLSSAFSNININATLSKTKAQLDALGLYEVFNVGDIYRVYYPAEGSNSKFEGVIIPNCKCGSNTYADYLYNGLSYKNPASSSISAWYSTCPANSNVILSECDITAINVIPPTSFNTGIRFTASLNASVMLKGGSGTKTDPYVLGVNE